MGRDNKGRELGIGITQRKDGLYTGRFTRKNGKRTQKYFKKLQDCRAWMAEEQYKDEHSSIEALQDVMVDAWFEFWMEEAKENIIRNSTKSHYIRQYQNYMKPLLGKMLVADVRSIHCQRVLNMMVESGLKQKTINDLRVTMYSLFQYAVENAIIMHNPVTQSVKGTSKVTTQKKEALSIFEQREFLTALSESEYELRYGNQFRFILQTGLRCGELTGLKWSDIDFEKRVLHVTRTMNVKYPGKHWVSSPPKTKAGIRDVPLTDESIAILKSQRQRNKSIQIIPVEFAEYVFLNQEGTPTSNYTYDMSLDVLCRKNGLKHVSMHILRHTFATRCIEGGMRPKTLQQILGHSKLSMTMDLYVHVTEDEKQKEMEKIHSYLKVV